VTKDEVEHLITQRRHQELREKFVEVAPGLFEIRAGHQWTKEDLLKIIKRRVWEKQLRKEHGVE